jgi:hypothetical protein
MIIWPVKFVESKYSKWYESLIHKAQLRGSIQGYKETHHIIPRSFGGNNSKSNLVQLTAREHYIAHALLWKMKFEGIYGSKMAFAFNTFINKMSTKERGVHHTYKINSKTYETFRKQYAEILSQSMKGEKNHYYGKKHSEEIRRVIGEKSKLKEFKKGPENPQWGKKQNVSKEGKKARADAISELWSNPERRKKVLETRKIANSRPEVIAKRKAASDAKKGVKRDPAIMEKCAAAKRGKKEHEIYSPEAILKRKEALKNRVLSDEAKEKIRIGALKGSKMPKVKKLCPHCGNMFAGNMLARYHGDNCKSLKEVNNVG